MTRTNGSTCVAIGLLALAAWSDALRAQTPVLERPVLGTPTVIVGPASLSAFSSSKGHVFLSWPAVTGAEKYRITRIANEGDPEITIAEGNTSWFVFEGATCTDDLQPGPDVVYSVDLDAATTYTIALAPFRVPQQIRPADDPAQGSDPAQPSGVIYPHEVRSGKLYTYRVWSIFPGSIVSPPSPPATVEVK